MATIISGLSDTSSPVSAAEKPDMDRAVKMLDPETTQFYTMLSKLPSTAAESYKIQWLDDELMPRSSALAASAASDATAFTVTTNEGNYFKAGDIVRIVTTGEAVRVTATAASALTVVRAIGAVSAASAASSASSGQLVIVGSSNAQGGTLPTRLITKRNSNFNYTSIQKDSFGFTNTEVATAYFDGNQYEFERMKKAIEHKRNIENTLWFGARSYSASSPPRHTAGGVAEFLASATNSTTATTLDKGTLNDFFRTGLQHGSQNKVLFAAPIVTQVIGEFLQDNWVRATPSDTKWGVRLSGYVSGIYGTDIPVVTKRDWGNWSTGTLYYGSGAYLIDMEYVKYRPLRPTEFQENIQAPDADEKTSQFITEHSFQLARQEVHAKLVSVLG